MNWTSNDMLTRVNVVKASTNFRASLLPSSSFIIFFITATPLPRTLVLKGEFRKSLTYFISKLPSSIVRRTIPPLNQQLRSSSISPLNHTPIQNHPRFQSSFCHCRQGIKLPISTISFLQKRYMKDIMYLGMARQLQLIGHLSYLIIDLVRSIILGSKLVYSCSG